MKLDLALVHYPVLNKNNEIIGSAVTNLDIHDIARVSRTYGVDNYYIVTPIVDQQQLVGQIIDHWQKGHGAQYNPDRKEAFSIIQSVDDLSSLYEIVEEKWQQKPMVLATSARRNANTIEIDKVRKLLADDVPVLLLFGTGWGLAPEVLSQVDGALPPVGSEQDYNHLSVRSAASIMLDRLLGV